MNAVYVVRVGVEARVWKSTKNATLPFLQLLVCVPRCEAREVPYEDGAVGISVSYREFAKKQDPSFDLPEDAR